MYRNERFIREVTGQQSRANNLLLAYGIERHCANVLFPDPLKSASLVNICV